LTIRFLSVDESTRRNEGHSLELLPGIRVTHYHWSYILTGNRDVLIAANFAASDWFTAPGERDKRGRVVRGKRFTYVGRRIYTCLPVRGVARLDIHFTESEQVEVKRFHEYKKKRIEAQKGLACMAHSENIFRKHCLLVVGSDWPTLSSFITGSNGMSGGFRFDRNAIEAVQEKYSEIAEILRGGRVTHCSKTQRREIGKCLESLCEVDPTFSTFMSTITSGMNSTSRKDS
jgi:hypothetical protein